MDVIEELRFLGNLTKFFFFGGGGGGVGGTGRVGGGQGGCDRRIKVFGKIHKENKIKKIYIYIYIFFFFLGGGVGVGWGGGGVRVNMIEELKFLGKFSKKFRRGGGGSGGVR